MKRKTFLQKYFRRFTVSLLLLGAVVYTVYHTFSLSAESLMTIPARGITDNRIISGEAYLFREETLLTIPKDGVIDNVATSGSKVGSGVTLCEVWTDGGEDFTDRQTLLNRLNRAIRVLEESQLPAGTPLSEVGKYRSDAAKTLLEIRQALQQGSWNGIAAMEDEMLSALNHCTALTGNGEELTASFETLREQKELLLTGNAVTVSNQGASGYFYDHSCVDGYESVFTQAELSGMTAARFTELKAMPPQTVPDGFAVGKMAYGYDWHLAVGFPDGAENLFESGKRYEVTFPENGGRVLSLTCERILAGESGETVVILRSDVTPADFYYLRGQRVEITVDSCTGYYIPETALTEAGGVTGVYVLEGSTVYFRKVKILRQGDGYGIAAENNNGEIGFLALNDLMVTSGKKLYDGKVYK